MEDYKHDKLNILRIVERPSSCEGMAFDINIDDNNVGKKTPKAQNKTTYTNLNTEAGWSSLYLG